MFKKLSMEKLKNRFLGSSKLMEMRYHAAYASGSPSDLVLQARKKTTTMYAVLGIVLVALLLRVGLDFADRGKIEGLERGSFGDGTKQISASVEGSYDGAEFRKDVILSIQSKALSTEAMSEKLEEVKTRLPKLILGSNKSLNKLSGNLNLIEYDAETGIGILWESDMPELISDRGEINFIEGKGGETVVLTANLRMGDLSERASYRVILGKPSDSQALVRDISKSLDAVVDGINKSRDGKAVTLPKKTESGIALKWAKTADHSILLVLPILFICAFLVYRQRYSLLDKKIEARNSSIRSNFPDFLGKLILLIQAGMVVTGAIDRICDGYRDVRREGEENALYEELCGMNHRMKASNSGLTQEFRDLAMRSGIKEVQRFSAILSDNINKGSLLSEKLARERDALWNLRKKLSEEKGKLAETKLTFPMVIQLLVIILITVAPAALQMG
jgi:hypothetical protein